MKASNNFIVPMQLLIMQLSERGVYLSVIVSQLLTGALKGDSGKFVLQTTSFL